ncbi:MAG TPA: NAD-dependent epimerase/dehydratase family protein [Rhodospirillaceae bacterium]|nr:NAD-dependent epimerase/dehydratase family protein [Rhodospirillaceae bacterium]
MAKFLVTGGLGFIGSHLVDNLLAEGHQVRVLDDLSSGRRGNVAGPIELLTGSVTDPGLVGDALAGADGCFHLAAIASVARATAHWRDTNAVNLGGTITVFEAALRQTRPIPVVYASSAAVYGDAARLPLSEDMPVNPLSAYGADKHGCEVHARIAGRLHGLPTFGLRPFNVYGPRQDPGSPYAGVISIFVDRARRGDCLPVIGEGLQERDFVYVGDVVEFLRAAMPAADRSAPVVNVCTGRSTPIRDLARTVIRLCGSGSRITRVAPRPDDILRSQGDPALARHRLAAVAATGLEIGLSSLLHDLHRPSDRNRA